MEYIQFGSNFFRHDFSSAIARFYLVSSNLIKNRLPRWVSFLAFPYLLVQLLRVPIKHLVAVIAPRLRSDTDYAVDG